MKFTVQRETFTRLVSKAQGIVEKKSTLTVLSQVMMETTGTDGVRMVCTDYDVVLMDQCPATVEKEGRFVTSGKLLHDVLKNLSGGADVVIETLDNHKYRLTCGKFTYDLNSTPVDDYPRIEKPEPAQSIALPVNVFKKLLNKTAFCMSQEEARMNLNGVFFDFKEVPDGVTLICVATDGHRLAKATATFEGKVVPGDRSGDTIVHRKGIQEVRKLLEGESGELTIGFGAGEVMFKVGSSALYVRLIEERYPDYESVIPTGFNGKVTAEHQELVNGLRAMIAVTDPNILTVRLDIVGKEMMSMGSANPAHGHGRGEVPVSYDGEPTRIGFNYRYFNEALGVIEANEVVIKLIEPGAPAVIEPADPTESFTYVIMPVDEV